jgi:hypothetical protein
MPLKLFKQAKLVAYFANWETTLKALDTPPVSLLTGKEFPGQEEIW